MNITRSDSFFVRREKIMSKVSISSKEEKFLKVRMKKWREGREKGERKERKGE